MSHFAVLVVGDDVEKQLAPFQENNMGNCPREFLEFNDTEDELREEYETGSAEYVIMPDGTRKHPWDDAFRVTGTVGLGSDTHRVPEHLEKRLVPYNEVFSTLEEYATEWCGYKQRDPDKGRFGYWENPNKKWDWWQLGGRWSGTLLLMYGAKADQSRVDEVDFLGMAHRDRAAAERNWEEAIGMDIAERYFCFGIKKDETRDAFIKRKAAFSTFAVLKDGKWYERGEMGWWACVSNEMSDDEWHEKFGELVRGLPGDTLISIVDCHI